MRLNFSTMEYSCRKCMCSRTLLKTATKYEEIHSNNNEQRTNESLHANYLESKEIKRLHVNSVYKPSLYHKFPFFNTAKMLPQCSSHDFMEGKRISIEEWTLEYFSFCLVKEMYYYHSSFDTLLPS